MSWKRKMRQRWRSTSKSSATAAHTHARAEGGPAARMLTAAWRVGAVSPPRVSALVVRRRGVRRAVARASVRVLAVDQAHVVVVPEPQHAAAAVRILEHVAAARELPKRAARAPHRLVGARAARAPVHQRGVARLVGARRVAQHETRDVEPPEALLHAALHRRRDDVDRQVRELVRRRRKAC
eukprot:4646101-Prymnesium_polylepis.1